MPDYEEGYKARDGAYVVTGYHHVPDQSEIWEHQQADRRYAEYEASVKRAEEARERAEAKRQWEKHIEELQSKNAWANRQGYKDYATMVKIRAQEESIKESKSVIAYYRQKYVSKNLFTKLFKRKQAEYLRKMEFGLTGSEDESLEVRTKLEDYFEGRSR